MSRSAASTSARAADHNLASEQFPELNREFYDANPADYVHRRLRGLIISISDSPAIHDALVQGVSYGTTEIRRGTEHEDDQAATEAYASLESTNPGPRQSRGEWVLSCGDTRLRMRVRARS